MRFGLSDLEELPSLKEFEALAREALGSDEGVAPGSSEEYRESAAAETSESGEAVATDVVAAEAVAPESESEWEEHSHSTAAEAIEHVKEELADAEESREHEALATSEGMPSGQLDEDPPPPVVKSTAAGE